jgi:DNA-binding PadR family transcriptional regulator
LFDLEVEVTGDQNPQDFLPLSESVFQIMLSLVGEDRHGYGILKEVKARTEGRLSLAPGTLYGAIKRLKQQGLIAEVETRVDPGLGDERRRYYTLTVPGQRVMRAEAARVADLARQAAAKDLLPGWSQIPGRA